MNENEFNGMFFLSIGTLFCTSITLLIRFCYKSKCSSVECCCIKIKRDTETEFKEDEMTFRDGGNSSPKLNRI